MLFCLHVRSFSHFIWSELMCERIIGSTFMSCQAPPKATPPLEPAQNRSAAHKSLNRKVDLNLAMIGNCQFSALIDPYGAIVWCCMPTFASDPVFCALVGGADPDIGFFDFVIEDFDYSEQAYIRNTAIVVTTLFDKHGRAVQITDFAPRYRSFGRQNRPTQLIRQIKPLRGRPRITVRFRPAQGYGGAPCMGARGTNHISFRCADFASRLTSDLPISFITKEVTFILESEHSFVYGSDEPLVASPKSISLDLFERTAEWWDSFSRSLSIPLEWQAAVIRAAITLKLSQYEESGAIIAAHTTSIPEAPNTGRCWDYRFCWLRDAFHTVRALNLLSETHTMQGYIKFITNVIAAHGGILQPMYGILFETELIESIVSEDSLPGYQGTHNGPVRVGNAAYSQIQNDNEGSVLMAVAQAFFDTRVTGVDLDDLLCILERLGTRAFEQHDKPDSGIWELRGQQRVHTFSAVMSWVACHRLASLCQVMQRPASAVAEWELKASIIKQAILERAWDPEQQAFIATMDGTSRDMDASLLLMAEVQFLPAEDPRFVSTVRRIGAVLLQSDFLMRYTENDDFGAPESAFNICTFWYIDALVSIGEHTEARRLFENMLTKRNHVGLLSEDFLVAESSLYGNFPQLYSMCGIIQSASKLSRSWSEIGL